MNKNNLFPRRIKDIKGKAAVAELRRAHYIIVILSAAFAFQLIMNMYLPLQFDVLLGSTAAALILLVAGTSLATAIGLPRK